MMSFYIQSTCPLHVLKQPCETLSLEARGGALVHCRPPCPFVQLCFEKLLLCGSLNSHTLILFAPCLIPFL